MNDNTEKELMSLLSCKDNMEKTAIILDRYQKLKDKFFEEQFVKKIVSWAKRQDMEVTDEYAPDFITFLHHHIAYNDNQ